MKSVVFKVDFDKVRQEEIPEIKNEYYLYIEIPMLPAYSIEYFTIQYGPLNSTIEDYKIVNNNQLKLHSVYTIKELKQVSNLITIHYHGIKDFGMLFPWINDYKLRNRLGFFYEEAEKNFEMGSWLSFSIMCGAVFEGMLYAKLNFPSKVFEELINDAFSEGIISEDEKDIMDRVRKKRNLVHSNNYKKSYITRKTAMDIRNTLNKLLKKFC